MAMGAADIVPGVSGGTMALILGIYERLIESLRSLARPRFLGLVRQGRFAEAAKHADILFLVVLAAGIFTSVLSLARVLESLLENQPVLVNSFFFGLIVGSVWLVGRQIEEFTPLRWILLGAATIATFLFVGLSPGESPSTPWFLFLAGALAVSALLLPGISGAFILVLLDKYEFALAAISGLQFGALLPLGLGAVTGLLTFTQLLGWLFHHYRHATLAILTGVMLGSLRKLWPWQQVHEGETQYQLPAGLVSAGDGALWALLAAGAGLAVVLVLGRFEQDDDD